MCLAVPAQLVDLNGDKGVADLHGSRVQVTTLLVPEVQVGDWILMHAGFAIQRLSPQQAEQTWSVLREVAETDQEQEGSLC